MGSDLTVVVERMSLPTLESPVRHLIARQDYPLAIVPEGTLTHVGNRST
jgi:hypothetical protein